VPQPSRLLVNTGTGKGKSSAAFGVMTRAWARGWDISVVQFIKSEKWKVGECKLAKHLDIDWHTLGDSFTWESSDLDETAAKGRHAWEVGAAKIASGDYDLVILDEATYVVKYGWVPVEDVVTVLAARPERTNVIVTGRYAPDEVIAIADTVTDMTKVKHAMDVGIGARKGIEY
jgi:cob(I)alamin adenosyltransferase